MTSRRPSRKRFGGTDGANRRPGRKDLQLCRQVQRALIYAFSDCGDDVVGDLFVESVAPAPDSTHLLVSVSISNPTVEPLEALKHLQIVTGRLREEVARAISRKKVPELGFVIAPKILPEVPPRSPAAEQPDDLDVEEFEDEESDADSDD